MSSQKGSATVVITILIVLVFVGGAMFYFYNLDKKNSEFKATSQAVMPIATRVPQATPVASTSSSLSDQLNSVKIDNIDDNFSQVDQDLKNLN